MKIFNVGSKSVNLYLLISETHRLLIDAGFPNSINELGRQMRKTGFKIREIDFLIVTHFHPDHAGAIQEVKNRGVKFVLFNIQQLFIKPMEDMMVGKWPYTPLERNDNMVKKLDSSREFLKRIDIHGRIISTPGHSEDSISLILDSGEAFTGDLTAEHLLMEEMENEKNTWEKLKKLGVTHVYPGHGTCYEI